MPHSAPSLPLPTHDLSQWDGREAEEEAEDPATTVTGYPPASAQRFHITSLQHWIDLCA